MNKYNELKLMFCKEELTALLCDKKCTYRELQNLYGYNERLFSKLSKEYNIPKQYSVITNKCNEWHKINFNLHHIEYLYFDLNKSLREIAKIYKCTHQAVSKFLRDNNIEIRNGNSVIYYDNRRKKYSKFANVDSCGYIILLINGERIREHRYVLEQHLHRQLSNKKYVHHIDFDKTNNDINNLFLFENDELHILYHGYIENYQYISPNKYLEYYEKNLKNTYDNYNWLYDQYINTRRSCSNIAQELKISRNAIVNKLKSKEIYFLRKPTVNQYS